MGGKTEIQAAPTTPAPSASESAADIYKAKLEYDPKMAALEMQMQQQYAPQQAALYSSMYNQYYPQMAKTQQALQQELYPVQSQILEAGATKALERLNNPNYMTTQEQTALESSRSKAMSDLQRSMRERSNLGGGLYGGRAAGAEAQSMADLQNQFVAQDYANRMNAGQQAQANLTPYMQILYPQIGTQQPQTGAYQYSSAVPSADTLYNAYFQASQPQQFASQKTDYLSQILGIGGGLGAASIMASSNRYKENIKLWGKPSILSTN